MKPHNYDGEFIVLEGPDGAGKSTQTGMLVDYLTDKGANILETKEPTEHSCGEAVYEAIEDDLSPEAVSMQFAADRLQHLERDVEPALKEGRVVVSDRYAYSSMAYQPALQHQKREISRQRVEKLNKDIILPDLAVLIDVDPETGLERISVRGEKTDYEELEMQRKVRQNYHGMKDREEVVAVDGSKALGEVHSQITETVEDFLDI